MKKKRASMLIKLIQWVITMGFGIPTFWTIAEVGPHGFSRSDIHVLGGMLTSWFLVIAAVAIFQDVRQIRRQERQDDTMTEEPLTVFYLPKDEGSR